MNRDAILKINTATIALLDMRKQAHIALSHDARWAPILADVDRAISRLEAVDMPVADLAHVRAPAPSRRLEAIRALPPDVRHGLPVVVLKHPSGRLECTDGYHRVCVARELGEATIRAVVYDFPP